jgi:uncharacterized protein YggE
VDAWGSAKIQRKPDLARIYALVEVRHDTVAQVTGEIGKKARALLANLVQAGLAENEISSDGPNVEARFEKVIDGSGREIIEKRRPAGFQGRYVLTIKAAQLDAVPKLLTQIADAGAMVRSVDFQVADTEEIYQQLEERAVADALSRARRLIAASGSKPGRVLSITAPNDAAASGPARSAVSAVATIPIMPPSLTMERSMQVQVEILPQ